VGRGSAEAPGLRLALLWLLDRPTTVNQIRALEEGMEAEREHIANN
jgi:hypothetical protein